MCLRKCIVLLLLSFLLCSCLNAITVTDLTENLKLSQSLLERLNSQLIESEKDLNSKNELLLSFQKSNSELDSQLTTLKTQYEEQSLSLKNLQAENQQLTETSLQLEIQLHSLTEQLEQQSKLSSKKGWSSNLLWFIVGVVVGSAAAATITISMK